MNFHYPRGLFKSNLTRISRSSHYIHTMSDVIWNFHIYFFLPLFPPPPCITYSFKIRKGQVLFFCFHHALLPFSHFATDIVENYFYVVFITLSLQINKEVGWKKKLRSQLLVSSFFKIIRKLINSKSIFNVGKRRVFFSYFEGKPFLSRRTIPWIELHWLLVNFLWSCSSSRPKKPTAITYNRLKCGDQTTDKSTTKAHQCKQEEEKKTCNIVEFLWLVEKGMKYIWNFCLLFTKLKYLHVFFLLLLKNTGTWDR